MEGATNTLDTLLSTTDTISELIIGTITAFIQLILSNPYLMIGVVLMLIGAGVSFLKRLIRV